MSNLFLFFGFFCAVCLCAGVAGFIADYVSGR